MTSSLMDNYGNPKLEFDHGKGTYLFTGDGEKFLDFAMGIAVNCLGHCHPALIRALRDQADKLWHTSNLYRIAQSERLASRLAELTFADRTFFCNSGTEAVECGFKIMRRFQYENGQPQRKRIISVTESFHGRTLAPIAAAANPVHMEGFLIGDSGFDQAPFGDIEAMAKAIDFNTAGIVIEPVQGEGGIRLTPIDYLQGLRDLCDEHGLLLMFDEVQCGMGRTGSLFAYQQLGVKPDILASAKALGGGFPIGACLATAQPAMAMKAGSHGSTFGGNPLACAVANAVLDELTKPGFLDEVRRKGEYVFEKLQSLVEQYPDILLSVSGTGLMLGLNCQVSNTELSDRLIENNLLTVKAGKNSIRLLPPLTVSYEELDEGLEKIAGTLGSW